MAHALPRQQQRSESSSVGLLDRLKRVGLLSGMVLAALNAWTGSPLLALWVGARAQGRGPLAMSNVFLVTASMGVFSYALLRILRKLGNAYDRLTGRPPSVRAHNPWLRSMRDGRPHETGDETSLSALDIVLVLTVLLVVVLFEIWFFFYSTSPIDGRSGR